MDKYEAIHGRDVSSFDLTSTHRMPTVSAAQALDHLRTDPGRFVASGLDALDEALAQAAAAAENHDEASSPCPAGVEKGQLVEVWGPPGAGKTAFAMQLAANALRDGGKVVWVDAFHPICHQRLQHMIHSSRQSSPQATAAPSAEQQLDNFVHYSTPTLAHLIGLVCRPAPASVPAGTSVVVIDTLSALLNHAFPKNLETRQTPKGPGTTNRRLQVLQFIISALQKLAATRDLAILILSQCATRMQAEGGATLIPAINAGTWEQGLATRLVLFRDWVIEGETVRSRHLVSIQKCNGKPSSGGIGPVFAFNIGRDGLAQLAVDGTRPSLTLAQSARQKRKLDQTGFEVADSEGEDYGWEDEDQTNLPTMPPQWQGSEDLLVGQTDDDGNRMDDDGASEGELPPHRERLEQVDTGHSSDDEGDPA
ncbi:P-loop containing nucleoside triphosphate hydrolase protein [Xylariaceae sp. FL0804]|nr:P-loop containing nucleoside triphosphate hydrolase protein [Xylariaceae sp. FL0804]